LRYVTSSIVMVVLVGALAPAQEGMPVLKYGDGRNDGKQSLGGSGEMIEFTLPPGSSKVANLSVHGSRYGPPQPPEESYLVFFLGPDRSRIIHTEMAPYSLFGRGVEAWVTIPFPEPVEVPERFWVALDFRAHQRRGVYVSYDTSTGGKHSRVGLPGMPSAETKFGGDWMIEAVLGK